MRNVVVKLLVMTWAHVSMLIRASSCEVLVYGTKNAGSVDIKGLVVRFHRRALGILRCFCVKLLRAMPRVPRR